MMRRPMTRRLSRVGLVVLLLGLAGCDWMRLWAA